jgi:phospholipase C
MEKFLSNKSGKRIEETNISAWRRTVCGDLTSVFKPYNGEKITAPSSVEKDSFYESIHKAQFKKDPSGYKQLTKEEIEQINKKPSSFSMMPRQEKGTRSSCPLPYQLYADGKINADKKTFDIVFAAKNEIFGQLAAGSPFNVYAQVENEFSVRNYAVAAGDQIADKWYLNEFENQNYHLRVNGPNGFFREFRGDANDPAVNFVCEYARKKMNTKKLSGNIELRIINQSADQSYSVELKDNAYNNSSSKRSLGKKGSGKDKATIVLDCSKSYGWYDFTVKIGGAKEFEKRYAGRVETGEFSRTDPAMGNIE